MCDSLQRFSTRPRVVLAGSSQTPEPLPIAPGNLEVRSMQKRDGLAVFSVLAVLAVGTSNWACSSSGKTPATNGGEGGSSGEGGTSGEGGSGGSSGKGGSGGTS